MSERPDWDDQFRETEAEIADRWKRVKAQRAADGKCWQCAKQLKECSCNAERAQKGTG
jgi:hypothetical protein